jgi:hypothetical protein
MAHLWVRDGEVEWAVLPLDGDAMDLGAYPPRRLRERPGSGAGESPTLLMQTHGVGDAGWVLLAGPRSGVNVNGIPVLAGILALSDRDEIRVRGFGSLFFSTETLARVEPFPASDHKLFCPRCKQPIESGALAVRCPGCRVWHHQSADLPCWSYAPTCTLCPHPTEADARFRWTPEEL